ncbi:cell wall-associated hydrolases domain protein, partial [Escherichia coli 5.2239]
MTPDRMRSSLPFFRIPLPFTQLFRQMVKQFTVAAVYG